MSFNRKRKDRPGKDRRSSHPRADALKDGQEESRIPHNALYFQAHEADIIRGPSAMKLAKSLEASSLLDTVLVRVGGIYTSEGLPPPADVWVDRYDTRLLLDPFDSDPSSAFQTLDSSFTRADSPSGWSELPSDTEHTFFFSPEEVGDYHREKKRRTNEHAREERLLALSPEIDEDGGNDEVPQTHAWGDDEEEPDDSVKRVMQKTARLILSASNSTQMEMKILVDFSEKQPEFAFLKGRWQKRWDAIREETSRELEAEKTKSSLGGLADYGDSDEDDERAGTI